MNKIKMTALKTNAHPTSEFSISDRLNQFIKIN